MPPIGTKNPKRKDAKEKGKQIAELDKGKKVAKLGKTEFCVAFLFLLRRLGCEPRPSGQGLQAVWPERPVEDQA